MENKVKEIANAMKEINLLSSFELSKERVLSYAEKIVSLFPNVSADNISFLMDEFFLNKLDFIPSKGIRNFTEHLPKIISNNYWKNQLKNHEK